jgi:hypothetical protein
MYYHKLKAVSDTNIKNQEWWLQYSSFWGKLWPSMRFPTENSLTVFFLQSRIVFIAERPILMKVHAQLSTDAILCSLRHLN